jgi:pimeloyl-ACP methyl ester carboxylesterase
MLHAKHAACLAALAFAALSPALGTPLPSLSDTISIQEWLVSGPFTIGPREGITGVVEDPLKFQPREGDTFRSGLVQGGITVCRKVRTDSLDWLEVTYDSVRWDSIQDYYGNVGLFCAGFAYAEFESPGRCRALAVATKLGGFVLNGRSYVGDVYGNGWFRVPVQLDSGLNRVLLRISGFGEDKVRFLLVPAPARAVTVCADATVPDLAADSTLTAWVGIPLLNTTEDRLDSVRLHLSVDTTTAAVVVNNLPAFGVSKVPVRLRLPATRFDSANPWRNICVSAVSGPDTWTETLRLAVRKPAEPRRQTFLSSIDGSVQYYAVLYPEGYDPTRAYPLILSLHGAGVEAWGQANAYRQKDWAFVVAATNRRPFGFDWQDWGRLDAMEVLDTALARFPIDRNRVLLTGHSMGGHGTWHVGLTHPDRFAAAAPEAGWPSHPLYVPWFLQRSAIFAQPGQLAVRDMALRPDNAPAMLENSLNLPLFILHGGDDDNVPTIHGRNFAEWLRELGCRFKYKEVPGQPHWWSYLDGTSCLDDSDLMSFLRSQKREPGPRHVRFRTADLGTSHRAYWCDIERVAGVGQDAEIEAWALDTLVKVRTANVAQFSLELLGQPFFSGRVGFVVDGQRVGRSSDLPARVTFNRTAGVWRAGPARAGGLSKTPRSYGPCKQAMMSPFVLVYGTGDAELTGFLRHTATQEAMRWWLVGNGTAQVLPDTEVTDSVVARANLVLYGGPGENSVTRRSAGDLPVQVRRGHVFLGSTDLGDSLAAICVYPNPLNRARLVLVRMGTGPDQTRLSTFFSALTSSSGIPDFMVFDRSVRRFGWAGVRAAGFFGPDWQLDPRSSYVEE